MSIDLSGNTISSNGITYDSIWLKRITRDGIVLYLDSGNSKSYNGGTIWYDLSDSIINGTLTGGVLYSGTYGGEFTFDGNDDQIYFGTFNTSSPISTTLNFTIEQIFMPTGYQGSNYYGMTNVLLCKGNLSTINYLVQLTDSTTATFVKRGSSEGLLFFNFTVPSMTNVINVLTFVIINSQFVKCFMNGVYIGEKSITGQLIQAQSSDPFRISYPQSGSMTFIGNYYECKIYNRALNPYEIAENFQAERQRFGI